MNRSERLARVRARFPDDSADAALITHLPNIFYLTGFRGSDGALLITPTRQILLVDGRYGTQAREQASGSELVVYPDKIVGIADTVRSLNVRTLGFEARSMVVELFQNLQKRTPDVLWKPLGPWITSLRARKDSDEISLLTRANGIADRAVKDVLDLIEEGMTEIEVATELEYLMKKSGAEKASFSLIVAGGERAALPHAAPTERKLKARELCILDFGLTLAGYQTDQTLTISIGEPPARVKEVYGIVKEAHDRAIAAIKPGVNVRELDGIARRYIADRGYGDNFNHSLGHGVGIEVHEYPLVSSKSDCLLEEGMTLTIEPGIYLPGEFGVRIEDTLLVMAKGSHVLTGVDKALCSL